MAFFGNLLSIPLPNLLTLLSSRSGVLTAEDYFKRYRLSVEDGRLCALELDFRERDVRAGEHLLLNLLDAGDSIFEFRTPPELDDAERTRFLDRCSGAPTRQPLQMLALSLAKIQDDLEHLNARLPHPDTVFIAAQNGSPEAEDPPQRLEGALGVFWAAAGPVLEWGVSCRELSVYADYPLRAVLLCIHSLAARGLLLEKPREDSSEQVQKLGDLVSFEALDALE